MRIQKKKRQLIPLKWKICTEGVSESNYLKRFIVAIGIENLVEVCCKRKINSGCGKQHEKLLEQMQNCGQTWEYEKIFLVHDYDKADEIPAEKKSFNKTFMRSKEMDNLRIIYSNPCFEYWLMLHINYYDSNLSRHEYQRKVKDFCNQKRLAEGKQPHHDDDYKSDSDLFTYFGGLEGAKQAIKNAKKRFEAVESRTVLISNADLATNAPCTNIFELLEELMKRTK